MSRWLRLLPVVLLGLLLAALVWRLSSPQDQVIRSRLIGQAVPPFALPAALPGKPGLTSAQLAANGPVLVNLFASWCVPCITEAPQLAQLERGGVVIDAIAIRDRPQDIAGFLARNGDPFRRIGSDSSSRAQLALGSAGVPESFIVDARGIIRYQHIGPIEPGDVATILREVERAR
jgi:cytochrome c biogenesis protein CcmG/thiol:disulfide interchange protein DsbE